MSASSARTRVRGSREEGEAGDIADVAYGRARNEASSANGAAKPTT